MNVLKLMCFMAVAIVTGIVEATVDLLSGKVIDEYDVYAEDDYEEF